MNFTTLEQSHRSKRAKEQENGKKIYQRKIILKIYDDQTIFTKIKKSIIRYF